MIELKNENLIIKIDPFGAELRSVYSVTRGREMLWSGDDAWWDRVSPVLFPIVGKLWEDKYEYDGKSYSMGQHGFLRDQTFEVIDQSDHSVKLSFSYTEETLAIYPFKFEVQITYNLDGNRVDVIWTVINLEETEMLYAIGAHPGFALEEDVFHTIEIEQTGPSKKVLLNGSKVSGFEDAILETINVNLETLKDTTLIYSNVHAMTLHNHDDGTRVRVSASDFDYMAVWSPSKEDVMAPFVCIEPWLGLPDEVNGYENLNSKLDIKKLGSKETSVDTYSMEFL